MPQTITSNILNRLYLPFNLKITANNDYKLVSAPGDGTLQEKLADNLKVSLSDIDEIRINDMVTELLLNKLKTTYNI